MKLEKILSKIRSVKLCLEAHPDYEKDSEFEDRVSDLESLEKELRKCKIESVDRYYYMSGRNAKTYVEVTFYFNPYSLERTEVQR